MNIDEKSIEKALTDSSFIYRRGYATGYEAGQKEAFAQFKRWLDQTEKLALLGKQAE